MIFISRKHFENEVHRRVDEFLAEADRNRTISDINMRLWKLEGRADALEHKLGIGGRPCVEETKTCGSTRQD